MCLGEKSLEKSLKLNYSPIIRETTFEGEKTLRNLHIFILFSVWNKYSLKISHWNRIILILEILDVFVLVWVWSCLLLVCGCFESSPAPNNRNHCTTLHLCSPAWQCQLCNTGANNKITIFKPVQCVNIIPTLWVRDVGIKLDFHCKLNVKALGPPATQSGWNSN